MDSVTHLERSTPTLSWFVTNVSRRSHKFRYRPSILETRNISSSPQMAIPGPCIWNRKRMNKNSSPTGKAFFLKAKESPLKERALLMCRFPITNMQIILAYDKLPNFVNTTFPGPSSERRGIVIQIEKPDTESSISGFIYL